MDRQNPQSGHNVTWGSVAKGCAVSIPVVITLTLILACAVAVCVGPFWVLGR